MSIYEEANSIIGKFVPKVYTRRITLEDGMYTEYAEPPLPLPTPSIAGMDYTDLIPEPDPDELAVSNRQQDLDSTIVTVDYFVKDLITETDVEVLARNFVRGNAGDSFRNIVSDCLDVYVIAVSNREVANTFYNRLRMLYQIAYQGIDPSFVGVPWEPNFHNSRFHIFVQQIGKFAIDFNPSTRNSQMRENFLISSPMQIRRVERYQERYVEEQFIRTNSQYERYNQDNGLFEKLPGRHVFNIDDLQFDNCDNLSIITFSRFDFERMASFLSESGMDASQLDSETLARFSVMISHPTHDIVTTSGRIKSEATMFLDRITRAPYTGPVHFMQNKYMTGFIHEVGSRDLDLVTVPVTKIQDFRKMQRTKLVNFEPPNFGASILDSAGNPVEPQLPPEISYLEKRNKNYFDLAFAKVDYDREKQHTQMLFMFGLESIYKNNSKYYEFLKPIRSLPAGIIDIGDTFKINRLLDIRSIRILRKRVSKREIGNTRIGSTKRKDFIPYEQETYSVVYRTNDQLQPGIFPNTMGTNQTITDQAREDGSRIRHRNIAPLTQTNEWMDWYALDNSESLKAYHGTGAVLQYGVEVVFVDRTKMILSDYLEFQRECITKLENLSQTLKQPIFKQSEMWDIAVHNFFIPKTIGYYDFATNSFASNAEDLISPQNFGEPSIDRIIDAYIKLIAMSFGATSVNITRSSVNILQRDDSDLFGDLTLITLIQEGLFDFDEIRPIFRNMINPRNSNPEMLDSFIKQYKDTLEQVENFLDLQDYNNPDSIYGGSGYTAKGNNHFTVKRWFNTVNSDPAFAPWTDDDNFVHMDPDESRLFYNYEPRTYDDGTIIPADLGQITLNPSPDGGGEFQLAGARPNGISFGGTSFDFSERQSIDRTNEERDNLSDAASSFEAPPGTGMYEALNGLVEQINIRRNEGREVQDVINSVDSAGQRGASDSEMEGILISLTEELRDDAITPSIDFAFQNSPENEQKQYGDLCNLINNSDELYEIPDTISQLGGGTIINTRTTITDGGSQNNDLPVVPNSDQPAIETETIDAPFDMRLDGQRVLAHVTENQEVQPILDDEPLIETQSYILMNIEAPSATPMIPKEKSTVQSLQVAQANTERSDVRSGDGQRPSVAGLYGNTGNDNRKVRTEGDLPFAGRKTPERMKQVSIIAAKSGSTIKKQPTKKIKEVKKTFNLSGAGLSNGFAHKVESSSITGGGGNDSITGGRGNDAITGGAGNDTRVEPRRTASTLPAGPVRNIRGAISTGY